MNIRELEKVLEIARVFGRVDLPVLVNESRDGSEYYTEANITLKEVVHDGRVMVALVVGYHE